MQFKHFLCLRGWKTATFKWWIVLERIRFTLSECRNDKTCILSVSNKWIIFLCCLSVQCLSLVYYWILLQPIATNGCHRKNCSTSTHFQYLSARFKWFPHETDIQKWSWPGLSGHRRPKLISWTRTWLLLASGVVLQTVIYKGLYGTQTVFLKREKKCIFFK